ncbi:hypothetical protein [Sphingomonas sp. 8AM]|uniref:hypothetical protein n=1 Tax=Sphingomonas sp. 8AM TaxID=2653170 RepID=UPI0012EFCFFA|nr:hypothetical protein [Sphingomonas sp. 8AM]VXD02816.1 conserved hypothetical protein [Sphingomonas sp. 8AM]
MNTERSLTYTRKPIRIVTNEAGIWLAAADLYALARKPVDRRYLAHFDPAHLQIIPFSSDAGRVRLTAVSPLGAVTVAKGLGYPYDRMLDAFLRRVTDEIAAEAGHDDLGYTLLADGTHPTRPRADHDNYLPWHDLTRTQRGKRHPIDLSQAALFDDDPVAGPHDPIGEAAKRVSVMEHLRLAADRMSVEDPSRAAKLDALMAR